MNSLEQVGRDNARLGNGRGRAGDSTAFLKRLTARTRRRRAKRELQAGREPEPRKKFRGWFW